MNCIINHPDDIDRYIFNHLDRVDHSMATVGKILRNQSKINKAMLIASVCGLVYMYLNEKHVAKLETEIKELKTMNGD